MSPVFCNVLMDELCNVLLEELCNVLLEELCNVLLEELCNVLLEELSVITCTRCERHNANRPLTKDYACDFIIVFQ